MTTTWTKGAARHRGAHPVQRAPRFLAPIWSRRLVYALLGAAVCGSLIAQPALALDPARELTQYQTRHWGPEEGLPCNNVLTVLQSSDGYLWLGTEEGLVRFDGVRAEHFERRSDAALAANNISAMIEDARNAGSLVFLGSSGNLSRFADGKIQARSTLTVPTRQPGQILVQSPTDGAFWIGTVHGLYRVNSNRAVQAPAAMNWPTEPINALCHDAAGRLWIGSARGVYRQRKPGDGGPFEFVAGWKGGEVNCLAPALSGGVWIGAQSAGVGQMDEDGAFHPRAALTGGTVTSLLEDNHAMLWVGTFGSGLYRLPVNPDTKAGKGTALTTANGLINNQINNLCEDREGNLWIATERGLQTLRNTRFINYGTPEGLASDDVSTVYEDKRNQVWIGTASGLSRLNPNRSQITNYPTPPSARRPGDSMLLCIGPGDAEGTLLAGTHAGLLRWQDGKLETVSLRDDLDGSAIRALCVDNLGNRWIGTNSGLYQERGGSIVSRATSATGLADNLVRGLHLDGAGNLWIATDGGLSRRNADGKIDNFLTNGVGSVLCFAQEEDGDLFVGTDSGLQRLHTTAQGEVSITTYTTRDGLFDNAMWCLLDDGRGNVWTSSNKGIARYAWADLDRFDRKAIPSIPHVSYDVQDGLRSREGNGGHQPVAWRDRTGALWFTTVKSAVSVDPALALVANSPPPPVRVEELIADGQSVRLDADHAPVLPAGTQKFELRYTALGLTAPEHNRFRYRLEPFEREWTDAGTERVAHYTNLPPGSYRFILKAANGDGVWNETGETVAFSLRPRLYQMIWFQGVAGIAVVGLGWSWLALHRRRLMVRVMQAEADVRERISRQEILNAAKEEAERARAEAERASNAKSEFLSRVSHELRTPLNAILGFGQLLELDDLSPEQSQSVSHILLGGRHLLGLVNEVLDLASIESGKLELDLEDVEVGPLLAETMALVSPLAKAKSVHIRVLPEAATNGTYVHVEGRRLKQVLLNLLDNAVKYNRPVDGEVFIDARVDTSSATEAGNAGTLQMSIRDTGTGMDADGLSRLFTPFERLGAAHTTIKGTGLGLAVSKQLVEKMGGKLRVTSEVGTGSTFWLELPLSVLQTASPVVVIDASELPKRKVDPTSEATLLYIEDNRSNLQVIEALLANRRSGWRLTSATEGVEGLKLARELLPDLVLLDLQLPGMSGDEILKALRDEPTTRHIPVIVLSADATSRSRERLLDLGADAYLTKPLDLEGLLTAADKTLRQAVAHS